jgi:hypothetical protein
MDNITLKTRLLFIIVAVATVVALVWLGLWDDKIVDVSELDKAEEETGTPDFDHESDYKFEWPQELPSPIVTDYGTLKFRQTGREKVEDSDFDVIKITLYLVNDQKEQELLTYWTWLYESARLEPTSDDSVFAFVESFGEGGLTVNVYQFINLETGDIIEGLEEKYQLGCDMLLFDGIAIEILFEEPSRCSLSDAPNSIIGLQKLLTEDAYVFDREVVPVETLMLNESLYLDNHASDVELSWVGINSDFTIACISMGIGGYNDQWEWHSTDNAFFELNLKTKELSEVADTSSCSILLE